jgi:pyruvate dehydrogenase E1 component beta subunit
MTGPVPKIPYRVRFGRAAIRRTGKDVTLVAIGSLVPMCIRVAEELADESIDVEVIDLRTISPIDTETILKSVSKTRRIAVADPAWESAGIAAEILAMVSENLGCTLEANPKRISLPDSHTPMSVALEEKYYVNESTITERIKALF